MVLEVKLRKKMTAKKSTGPMWGQKGVSPLAAVFSGLDEMPEFRFNVASLESSSGAAADGLSSLWERALGCGRWVHAMSCAVCDRTSAASLALPSVADKHVRGLPARPPPARP